jgi:phage gp29-like protein
VIEKATSYVDLREKLLEAYKNRLDATQFARLMEKTLILAELNGRYAIAEDL